MLRTKEFYKEPKTAASGSISEDSDGSTRAQVATILMRFDEK